MGSQQRHILKTGRFLLNFKITKYEYKFSIKIVTKNYRRKKQISEQIFMRICFTQLPVYNENSFTKESEFKIEHDGTYNKVRLPVNKLRSLQKQEYLHTVARIINEDHGGLDFQFKSEEEQSELIKTLRKNQQTTESRLPSKEKDLEDLSWNPYSENNTQISELEKPKSQNEKSKSDIDFDKQVHDFIDCEELPTLNTLSTSNLTQSTENTDGRVPWMNTVGSMIDSGPLTWDHTGRILSCPEDEEFFKQQLLLVSAKPLKYPLLSFKKNMANHLFRKLPSNSRRIRYTNELYTRDTRHDQNQMDKLMNIVQQRFKKQNEAKKLRKREGASLNSYNEKRAKMNQQTQNQQQTNDVFHNQALMDMLRNHRTYNNFNF